MNIRVDLITPIKDGTEVVFRSPVDCSQVTGLKVYYKGDDGNTASKEFAFADAHGNNVGDIDHLFAENVVVKVILDVTKGMAFVQNADTNAYLERRFESIEYRLDNIGDNDSPTSNFKKASGTVIALSDAPGDKLKSLTLYGKTTQDGTPTPSAPVDMVSAGDGGDVKIGIAGKNLCPPLSARTTSGITVTVDDDGVLHFSGTATGMAAMTVSFNTPIPAGTYTFSFNNNKITNGLVPMVDLVGSYNTPATSLVEVNHTWQLSTQYSIKGLTIMIYDGCVADGLTMRIQLECGSVATEYEPYKINSMTIATPNCLPGIPVTSNGNYTDENGQQWICDEVNFTNGVYVQRIGVIESYSNEAVSTPFMSTTGQLTSGATVQYVLAKSKETPLSASELAAYRALYTYEPNTTIYTDGGAYINVGYDEGAVGESGGGIGILNVTYDGNGNVTILNLTATDDGNGNVTFGGTV